MNRFNESVEKLYKAYNEGVLNAFNCKACAVGNIVGHSNWKGWISGSPSLRFSKVNWSCANDYPTDEKYTPEELKEIEAIFLTECTNYDISVKESQYNGLIVVINYLAELDSIPTIDQEVERFKEVLMREKV